MIHDSGSVIQILYQNWSCDGKVEKIKQNFLRNLNLSQQWELSCFTMFYLHFLVVSPIAKVPTSHTSISNSYLIGVINMWKTRNI